MSETFNWCFIGTGKMAKTAARQMAFTRSKSHRVVAAYSRTFEHTKSFAAWFGGTPYTELKNALSDEKVNAVYIATPHTSHFEFAMECIKHGKPVLVEKPFTLNAGQAEKLVKASKENGVYVAEAMWTWFSPIAMQVRRWLLDGEIGQVKTINIKYAMASSRFYRAPRLFDKNLGGGALLDIGVYPVSYCYNLLGAPDKIECIGELNDDLIDIGERITLYYNSGIVCNIRVSLTNFEGPESAVITGTKGVVTVPLFHQALRARLISDTKRETTRTLPTYMTEFDTVADEIRAGKTISDFVPQSASVDIMKILDICRSQMGIVYPQELREKKAKNNAVHDT